jgi:hypothetical protein
MKVNFLFDMPAIFLPAGRAARRAGEILPCW